MKINFLLTWLAAMLSINSVADADLFVDHFVLTDRFVSFEISGSVAGPAPEAGRTSFFFANTTAAEPGFVTAEGYEYALSSSWTGTQSLDQISSGDPVFGDYFFLRFTEDLSPGDELLGTFSADFSPGTFNPSEVDSINVIWGYDRSFSGRTYHDDDLLGGTLQARFATVPEASSILVLAILGHCWLLRRRITKR